MREFGEVEDGFTFSAADLARGAPRFWWGPRKRAAYDRVLDRLGLPRRDASGEEDGTSADDRDDRSGPALAAGALMAAEVTEKKTESAGWSWFSAGGGREPDSSGSSDSGGSSDGGGSDE